MMGALLLLSASLAGYAGFACLAMAMRRRGLRLSGTLMLCTALAICIWRDGASFGTLLWAILMSASAIAVTFTLTWCPQLLLWYGRVKPEN